MPRQVNEIEEQLADLNEVLEVAWQYGTPDKASKFGLESMLRLRQELLEELRVARTQAEEVAAEVVSAELVQK